MNELTSEMNSFSNGKYFPFRTCDRDFRQDQEKATPLPTGKPEGLSAVVQWSRQIEQAASFVFYNKLNGESFLTARKGANEMTRDSTSQSAFRVNESDINRTN